MARGNNQPRRNPGKKGSPLQRRAKRDIMVANQPAFNSINRQEDQLNLDFQNQWQGLGSIYGGEQKALQPLYGQLEKEGGQIADDLDARLTEFTGTLNQAGLPTNELAANTALYGQQRNNAQTTMANNLQRGLNFNQSAMREGALSERYGKQNLMQGLSDELQQLSNRELDIRDSMRPQILSRMDTLQDQAQDRREDQAYNEMLANLIGAQLSGGNNRGRPGPGGGGGGGAGASPDGRPNTGGTEPFRGGSNYEADLPRNWEDWSRQRRRRWRRNQNPNTGNVAPAYIDPMTGLREGGDYGLQDQSYASDIAAGAEDLYGGGAQGGGPLATLIDWIWG